MTIVDVRFRAAAVDMNRVDTCDLISRLIAQTTALADAQREQQELLSDALGQLMAQKDALRTLTGMIAQLQQDLPEELSEPAREPQVPEGPETFMQNPLQYQRPPGSPPPADVDHVKWRAPPESAGWAAPRATTANTHAFSQGVVRATPYGYHKDASCHVIKAHNLTWPEEGLSWFASRNTVWKPCGECCKTAAGSGQSHTDAAGNSSAGSSSCTPKKKGKTIDKLQKWYKEPSGLRVDRSSGSMAEGGCTDLMAPHTESGSMADDVKASVGDPWE